MVDTPDPEIESTRVTRRSRMLDPLPVDPEGIDVGEVTQPSGGADAEIEPSRKADAPTPEEAVAEAKRLADAKDAETETWKRRALDAERVAGERGRTAVDAITARMGEREASINAAIEANKSKKENAARAMRAAREANDYDADIKASEDHADAVATLANLRVEKSNFESEKSRFAEEVKRVPADGGRAPAGDEYSPAAKGWIASHPKFGSDAAYKAKAIGAHHEALSLGIPVDTPAYFKHLDTAVAAYDAPADGGRQPAQRRQPASSTATPPGREGGFSADVNAGGQTVKFRDGSTLSLVSGKDGEQTVQGRIPGEWAEAAVWSGVAKDKSDRKGIISYAVEQLKIMSATARGEDTGLRMGGSALLQ